MSAFLVLLVILLVVAVIWLSNRVDCLRHEIDVCDGCIRRLESENASLARENGTMNKIMNSMLDAANLRKQWRSDAGAQGLHARTPAVPTNPGGDDPRQ